MTAGSDGAQERWQRICAVLDAVFDAPQGERQRVIEQHCGGDASLRAEVEALLAAEDGTDRRLDTPAAEWAGEVLAEDEAAMEAAQAHSPGELIGDYRLVRELGRGGMGTVWLAEREGVEFSQQVALKLLKRGLDTDAVLGRFYDERRILARLRHPHIALFLDGGVADTGQPWFTMEWVDGAPITEWCDTRRLGVRERVTLFLDAVAAVQYAHQQLIVHRDLKPGNVLVSESGELKLLDFGIAKMLQSAEGSAQAATMTRMGVRMLTPAYAAPEQLRGDPATTATDVYALGVLLGELLSGKRSLSNARGTADAAAQRPSSRVGEAAAQARGTSVERLRRQLRGDLDTIVLKALSDEASRRYGSAQAFGEDLRRWLAGQPVQARPDSAWYRTRRFIGRHRLGSAAAAAVVASLVAGALVAGWQAREAARQADLARKQTLEAEMQARRAEEVKEFLVSIFTASNPLEWKEREPTAKDLLETGTRRLDELGDDPVLRAQMQRVIGEIATSRGDFVQAEEMLRRSLEVARTRSGLKSKDYADALHSWADLLNLKGDQAGAVRTAEGALSILQRHYPEHPDTAQAMGLLATLRQASGRPDEAIALRRKSLDLIRRTQGREGRKYVEQAIELGLLLLSMRDVDDARPLLDEALQTARSHYGVRSALHAHALNAQGRLMTETGETARAAEAYGDAAEVFRRAGSIQELGIAANNQGDALCRLGRFAEGERSYQVAMQALQTFAPRDVAALRRRNFGKCLSDAGWFSKAEPLLLDSSDLLQSDAEHARNFVLGGASHLLRLRVRQGRRHDSLALIDKVEKSLGPIHGTDGIGEAMFLVIAAPAWALAGDPDRALKTMRDAIRDLRAANAPENWVNSALLDLAVLELQAGDTRQAMVTLRKIGDALDGGAEGPQGVRARMLRGVAFLQAGDLDRADKLLNSALQARRRMYGDDNTWSGEARIYLGVGKLREGKIQEGRRLVSLGRAQFIREAGEDHAVVRMGDKALSEARDAMPGPAGPAGDTPH